MRFSAVAQGLKGWAKEAEDEAATAMTAAMLTVATQLKDDLREQVVRAGLGAKLSRTWQGQSYPRSRNSIEPAAYVWSKAPDIIRSFAEGATIRPVNGAKYLWIPTENVPRARGRRGASRRMTPGQVESTFNQDLIIRRGKKGNMLAFIRGIGSKNGRTFRPVTPGRLAQGRQTVLVLMFTLVPAVRQRKLLDLDGPLQRAAAQFNTLVSLKGD